MQKSLTFTLVAQYSCIKKNPIRVGLGLSDTGSGWIRENGSTSVSGLTLKISHTPACDPANRLADRQINSNRHTPLSGLHIYAGKRDKWCDRVKLTNTNCSPSQ